MEKERDMACIISRREMFMEDNGTMMILMEKDHTYLSQENYILGKF